MAVIEIDTQIHAPPAIVFDLARSVDAHLKSTASSGEKVVGGVREGLLKEGDEVIWEARHLFVRQRLHIKITEMSPPHSFVDEMLPGGGAFRSMRHEHRFEPREGGTLMTDHFDFKAPMGFLGRIMEYWVLKGYLTRFLIQRNQFLKNLAEESAHQSGSGSL